MRACFAPLSRLFSLSLSLAAVRPGAVMSTGSPRTQTACELRLTERQSGCAATVSSGAPRLRVPLTRSAVAPPSPAEGTPLPHVETPVITILIFVRSSKHGGPVSPPPPPPPVHRGSGESCAEIGRAKLGVQRRAGRDVDASRGNKEVKSAYPPPPQTKKKKKSKCWRWKNTPWLHARISWGTRGCPAAGESERKAGELLINQGDSQAVVFSE